MREANGRWLTGRWKGHLKLRQISPAEQRRRLATELATLHYCGVCRKCRNLDAWLSIHSRGQRMPWPEAEPDDPRGLIQSIMPAVEAHCRLWGPPR